MRYIVLAFQTFLVFCVCLTIVVACSPVSGTDTTEYIDTLLIVEKVHKKIKNSELEVSYIIKNMETDKCYYYISAPRRAVTIPTKCPEL